MSERDAIEPRACIALRLYEIDALLHCLRLFEGDTVEELRSKLRAMRTRLIENAKESVQALTL